MADKTIKMASFWYRGSDGVERTALRGETVKITDEADLERGERLDAFASAEDKKPGTVFGDFLAARQQQQEAQSDPAAAQPEKPPADQPSKNDSREKWADYARGKGAPDAELAPANEGGLTRDALRDKYGA